MKLSVKGLAGAAAVLWGGAYLFVGLINLKVPGYGDAFLELYHSIYPGLSSTRTIGTVLLGTLFGVIDGAVDGAIFAWLYNAFAQ
ncbi:MAG: hypothetical protein ABEK50_09715 [bacterium]